MTVNYTQNYDFVLYPTDAGTATFLSFRTDIAGYTGSNTTTDGSNTEMIDAILWERQTENINRRLYLVPLTAVTGGYTGNLYKDYPSNTIPFTSYNEDMRLIFAFPDNMEASNAVVNLQGIGSANLVKYDMAGGATVSLKKYDVLKNRNYLFRYTSAGSFLLIGQQDYGYIPKNVENLSTTKVLTNDSHPYQFLSCEGGTAGNRQVTLPVLSDNNIEFHITNTSPTYTITVKDSSATTIGIIRPKNTEIFASNELAWYLQQTSPENIAKTKGDLIVANANNTPANLAVSSNSSYYLGANSSNSDFGMEWRQIDHATLTTASIGTNTHAQIDTHIGSFSNSVRSHVPNATTIGQFFVSSNAANNSPVALPQGTNDYFIVANSSNATTGVSWRNYVKPRSANSNVTSTSSISFDYSLYDQYNILLNPSGTITLTLSAPSNSVPGITSPENGQKATIRIKNNYTGALDMVVANGSANTFRAVGTTFPTSIGAGVTMYIGSIYNKEDSRWDCVAIATEESV